MYDSITWTPGITLEQIEKQVILKAFSHYRNNKTTTSQALGISIRTLDERLKKYELEEKEVERANEHRAAEREKFLARSRGSVTLNVSTGTDILGHAAGIHVEPAVTAEAQSEMPVPKRREVQTVLPGPTPKSGNGKGR